MQKIIYTGDVFADGVSDMRRAKYVSELAMFYKWLGLSGELTVDWVLDQLSLNHDGLLVDPSGEVVSVESLAPEDAFGQAPRRTINAFKKLADAEPKLALRKSLIKRMMILDLARQIYIGLYEEEERRKEK